MANRYWVGGTASWDGTAGTKWATTSGGAGGASVPTSVDDVFFDAASGTATVTLPASVACKSLNFTGFTGTFTGAGQVSLFSGNLTIVSGVTWTHTGTFIFSDASLVTTAGKTLGGVILNNSTSSVSLQDALICSGTITITSGTFTTNNYNVTASQLSSNNSNTRTINLGSSTVTLSGSASSTLNFNNATNLTFNAGTSTILFTSTGFVGYSIGTTSITFYNMSFTNPSTVTTGKILNNYSGSVVTFNNLTFAGSSSAGATSISLAGDIVVNGTLTLSAGTNATTRTFVRSDTLGTTRTLTCNAVASLTDIDFRDITIAGSAAPVSGTRLGDCKGNSGITFPAPKTVYYRNTVSTNWSNGGSWSLTNGGSSTFAAFPLAQDTVVFPSSPTPYPSSGNTVTVDAAYNIGTIDMSARTSNTMTLACSQAPVIYGNWINGTGTTLSGTGTLTFAGRGSQTITSAGKTFTQAITIDSPSGTVQLGDAYSASNTITLTQGTFSAGTYNVTCTVFASSNTNPRTLNMGSGLWTITGTGTCWNLATETSMTLNKGSANILLSNNSTTARTFSGGTDLAYNKITIGGDTSTSTTTFINRSTYDELASTKTVAHTVRFSGTTAKTINTWSITGTSGNVVSVISATTGTQSPFSLTNVTSGIDYLAVQDINCTTANRFYVGANSTNNGNNTNVIFTAAPAPSASNSNFFLMFA